MKTTAVAFKRDGRITDVKVWRLPMATMIILGQEKSVEFLFRKYLSAALNLTQCSFFFQQYNACIVLRRMFTPTLRDTPSQMLYFFSYFVVTRGDGGWVIHVIFDIGGGGGDAAGDWKTPPFMNILASKKTKFPTHSFICTNFSSAHLIVWTTTDDSTCFIFNKRTKVNCDAYCLWIESFRSRVFSR